MEELGSQGQFWIVIHLVLSDGAAELGRFGMMLAPRDAVAMVFSFDARLYLFVTLTLAHGTARLHHFILHGPLNARGLIPRLRGMPLPRTRTVRSRGGVQDQHHRTRSWGSREGGARMRR